MASNVYSANQGFMMQLWNVKFTRKCFPHLKKKIAWKNGHVATMKSGTAKILKQSRKMENTHVGSQ